MITIADLGLNGDPGRAWHPGQAKFRDDGTLPDLTDEQTAEHAAKPEAAEAEGVLAAEDSVLSPEGEV